MKSSILGLSSANLINLGHGHKLLPEVAYAFERMQQAAKKNDINISICSSFRSFDKQLSIWNKKFSGELPLFTLNGDKVQADSLSDEEKVHAIMLWSALPGASRHHWGTDFDVYDKISVEANHHNFQLIPEEYVGDGPCAAMSAWIKEFAQEFGFYFPYSHYIGGVAAEPWHMSFKTQALTIEQQFNLEELTEVLKNSDILGKNTVLKLLPDLVERYTFNRGIKLD